MRLEKCNMLTDVKKKKPIGDKCMTDNIIVGA